MHNMHITLYINIYKTIAMSVKLSAYLDRDISLGNDNLLYMCMILGSINLSDSTVLIALIYSI